MLQLLPRSRRHRRWLTAAAAAGATAVLAPAAAQAADVSMAFNTVNYTAKAGEANRPRIAVQDANTVFVTDSVAMTASAGCFNLSPTQVQCSRSTGIDVAVLQLGDGADLFAGVTQGALDAVRVLGGDGNDGYIGGRPASPQNVRFQGGAGIDTADYGQATSRVIVNKDGGGNDGRAGIDRDNILPDVERLIGSAFNDALIGADDPVFGAGELFRGLAGDDFINGRRGFSIFDMGRAADGADTFEAAGTAQIDYSDRTRPVRVTIGSGSRDDGEAGEGDDLRNVVDPLIFGGSAGDTLLGANAPGRVFVDAGAGSDVVGGTSFGDTLVGSAGSDIVNAGAGSDSVLARDGERDTIDCGSDADSVDRDSAENSVTGCERSSVGVLRLTPKRITAEVGQTRALQLSWTHPRSWRKLRSVELRLRDANHAVVGAVKVLPRAKRVDAGGAGLRLTRRSVRLSRSGKQVRASIRLRPTAALAGERLSAEVEAVDTAGRRQVELDAAAVRIPRS
jgi:hypothetical protein